MDERTRDTWARVVSAHSSYLDVTRAFLTGPYDRVALMREALKGPQRATAFDVLERLPNDELLQLLPELVRYVSWQQPFWRNALHALLRVPRQPLLEQIDALAEPHLVHGTSEEYRQFLALFDEIDRRRMVRLVERARAHPDPEIRELADEYLPSPSEP